MARNLLKSTSTVSAMTLLSRVVGFIRDMVIARLFGAGTGADAFFVAFKIPNFMRRLSAEGAFSQAFVPVFAEYKAQRTHGEVKAFAGAVAGTFGGVLLLITVLGVVAAPAVMGLFAPGFLDEPVKFDLASSMLRLTFPYLLFISLVAYCAGILNTYGRFGVPAFAPVLLNVVLIAAAWWLAPRLDVPVMALAWGVFAAGAVQLLFQLPFLYRLGLLARPRWGWRDSGVRRVMRLMLPAIFGSSVAQINLLLDTVIASFLVTGSVSWLYYSDRLVEFPLGVFGIALATVILPNLSEKHANASGEAFSLTIDWALRWVLLISLPATLGLFWLAEPMLATLFQYGEFTVTDTEMAALSLRAYALGLTGFILVKVLAPGFYARQDTRTPVKIGVIAMVANMVLNITFVVPMAVMDFPGPHAGLALATSVAAFINAGLLFLLLRRQGVYTPQPGWLRLAVQVAVAGGLMSALLFWGVPDQWGQWRGWERAWRLGAWVVAGGAVYAIGLVLAGMRPSHLKSLLRHQ